MRYFLGFLVSIGLIILLIFMLFRGGGKPKVPATSKTLDSYATSNAEVRMTIDGPVNANQEHEQVRITVSQSSVTYQEVKGYEGDVVKEQVFPNTQSAYATFLLALSHAGFTQGDSSSALADERGYCALGSRYIFELRQDERNLQRYWTTSCGKPKTYAGSFGLTRSLFQAQVPGYVNLTQGIAL